MSRFAKAKVHLSSKKKTTALGGLPKLSLSSIFLDLYLLPGALELPSLPPAGKDGLLEDARNIRGYFQGGTGEFLSAGEKATR